MSPQARFAFPTGLAIQYRDGEPRQDFVAASLVAIQGCTATEISTRIADLNILPRWPTAFGGKGPVSPELQRLWLALYDVWLAANRSAEEAVEQIARLKLEIARSEKDLEDTNLEPLRHRMALFAEWASSRATHSKALPLENWYTVRLAQGVPALDYSEGSTGLGTLMLLSPRALPVGLLLAVRDWIQEVFFTLRGFEAARMHEALGIANGQLQLQEAFGHQVFHLASALSRRWWSHTEDQVSASLPPGWRATSVPEVFEQAGAGLMLATLRDEAILHVFSPWPSRLLELVSTVYARVLLADVPFCLATTSADTPTELRTEWLGQERAAKQRSSSLKMYCQGREVSDAHGSCPIEIGPNGLPRAPDFWATVGYFLLVAFENVVQHSDTLQDVVVRERCQARRLFISITNIVAKASPIRTDLLSMHGKEIMERIEKRLAAMGARPDMPDPGKHVPGDSYVVKLSVELPDTEARFIEEKGSV